MVKGRLSEGGRVQGRKGERRDGGPLAKPGNQLVQYHFTNTVLLI